MIENQKKLKTTKQSKAAIDLNKVDKLVDDLKSMNIKDKPTVNDEKLINKTDQVEIDLLTKKPDLVKPINKSKKVVNKIVKVVKDPMTTNPAQFESIDTPEKAADKLIDEEKSINIKDQPAIINDELVNDEKLINKTAKVVTDSLIEKPDLVKPINKSKKVVNKTDKVVEDPLAINPSEFEPIDTSKKVVELNKVNDKILNKADESIEKNKVPKKLEKTVSNVESPINKTDESIKEPINNNKTISSLWNWWK